MKQPCAYILASERNGTTSSPVQREIVIPAKAGIQEG